MAFLTIRIKGAEGYTRTALGKERMIVGRASATDIPIKHTSISREHCALVRDGDTWFVEDLGSSNSTWVGKVKVFGRERLNEKDIVKVGHARLTFHVGDLSEPEAAVEFSSDRGEDDDAPGETRQRAANDPPEAIACTACGGWFSIAHRLSGDTMPCPRCGQNAKIPILT
ncbi:MAG: FHA domain-containing protein [Planctomycetes bacterium]|nr:FHA domain-containing protein [Planctomycetota bacterium]